MSEIDVGEIQARLAETYKRRYERAKDLRAVTQSLQKTRRSAGGDARLQNQRELSRALQKHMPDAAEYFASVGRDFQQGADSRHQAMQRLGALATPLVPTQVTLDTAFLIWALRNGSQATSMLTDSHIEAGHNWATGHSTYNDGGTFPLTWDQTGFYFFWENPSSTDDVVVNAASSLQVIGHHGAHANPGWIWSPFWGQGTIGNVTVRVMVDLSPWQWWYPQPTLPLQEAGQNQVVSRLDVDGGFALWSGGNSVDAMVNGNFNVNYNSLLVPANGVVLFEVSLMVSYEGYDGSGFFDFDSVGFNTECKRLELEIATPAPMVSQ